LALLPPDVRLSAQNFYDRSFHVVDGQKLDDVLILGAGTGSDVASALRCGAKHVDAVEIDRAIYEIGKQYHPEHPYDSPKVTIHIADARNYLNTSNKKYDVIVYALLDSHTAFSSLSSLRTDNYVFTAESLRQASRLLKPDGYVVVCFVCYPDWLWDRHSKDIIAGAGKIPRGYFWITSLPTGFLVFGPSIGPDTKLNMIHPPRAVNPDSAVPSITDDWPFLFLPKREIPPVYVLPVLLVLLGSLIPLIKTASTGSATPLNWQMFFLGMGFMLLEVRALSAMSLLCGATWTVNSIIIAGVMVAILAANFLASRLSARAIPPLIILALVSIGLSTLVDANSLSGLDPTLANVAGTFIYLLPLFFAGAVFSSLFKLTPNSSQSLAYNMMGGLFGITIEYASMAIGVKLLSVFAVLIYLAVLGVNFARTKKESSAAAPSLQT
jgi:SAM-dependent methyltransferase